LDLHAERMLSLWLRRGRGNGRFWRGEGYGRGLLIYRNVCLRLYSPGK